METIKWSVNHMPKTEDANLPVMALSEVEKARSSVLTISAPSVPYASFVHISFCRAFAFSKTEKGCPATSFIILQLSCLLQ